MRAGCLRGGGGAIGRLAVLQGNVDYAISNVTSTQAHQCFSGAAKVLLVLLFSISAIPTSMVS